MIEARNPATLETIGAVAATPPAAAATAVAGVAAVTPLWAQLRVADRARYLERAAQAVIDDFDELVELIIAESGRPRVEIEAFEVLAAIDTLQWLATNARRLLSARAITLPRTLHPLKRASAGHTPRGVIAVLSAESSTFAMPAAHVAGALLGGNGALLKPALGGSQAAEALAHALARAGLPEGLVAVVHGGEELGSALAREPAVAHVLFSGSQAAGANVAAACAARGAGATLEIAASEAMIVLADSDLDAAAAGALWAACAGAGQLQGKLARCYVERHVRDPFLARLVPAAQHLTPGDPARPQTQLGPLASAARHGRMEEAVLAALALGARMHCGQAVTVEGLAGAFQAPTVLSGSAEQLAPLSGVQGMPAQAYAGKECVCQYRRGDLRPVVRARHARGAVLHRVPAPRRPALPGRRRRRCGAREGRGPAHLRRRRDARRAGRGTRSSRRARGRRGSIAWERRRYEPATSTARSW
jgi:acyl-CoA reductase-like NAD-dependent aldehyde dehydrogenase